MSILISRILTALEGYRCEADRQSGTEFYHDVFGMWNVMGQADTDYEKYLKASQEGAEDGNVQKASGYVQPYADSPLDGESVGGMST